VKNFDMIKQMTVDPMHAVFIGVVKKTIQIWMTAPTGKSYRMRMSQEID
jgi:hypothetical protein